MKGRVPTGTELLKNLKAEYNGAAPHGSPAKVHDYVVFLIVLGSIVVVYNFTVPIGILNQEVPSI